MHLSLSTGKPMDIFGEKWKNHAEKIKERWPLSDADTVVLAGDTSWAMSFDGLEADFEFLSSLKGRKIIIKGNHDYWWTSVSKLNVFAEKYGNIEFLNNSAFCADGFGICGSRGWILEPGEPHDEKIIARETGRLNMSLEACRKGFPSCEPLVFLHYPPVFGSEKNESVLSVMHNFGVKRCFYGHLHGGVAHAAAYEGDFEGIELRLISADKLDFCPIKIF